MSLSASPSPSPTPTPPPEDEREEINLEEITKTLFLDGVSILHLELHHTPETNITVQVVAITQTYVFL